MNDLVSEWIEKAEGDYDSAERELRARLRPNYDSACFDAQQCAEKYLKAFMVRQQIAFKPIHDLEFHLNSVVPRFPEFEMIRDLLLLLNDYAVAIRYPGERAMKAEAIQAVKAMRDVRTFIRPKVV